MPLLATVFPSVAGNGVSNQDRPWPEHLGPLLPVDPVRVGAQRLLPAREPACASPKCSKLVDGILVDVADYTHLSDGPGVVLVSHEADYYLDSAEGPLGLLYSRKTPLDGGIMAAFRAALDACSKLEAEPEFKGRLKFKSGEALVLVNDRLTAPNTDETLAAVKPDLEAALSKLYPGAAPKLSRASSDARARFGVRVTVPEKEGVDALLSRIR